MSAPARPDGSGVIHDIGYRHYAGPRLGRRAVWWALYADSLRGAFGLGRTARAKVVPLLLLAALCVPALIMAVVTSLTGADDLPLGYAGYVLNLQVLVALFVAAQAPGAVSRDLRYGVVPLLFSRPLRRSDYVLAKLAALSSAVLLLLLAPLTLLLVGALLAELPVGGQLPDYLRAVVLSAVLAVLLSALALLVAALTPRRGLGVAAVVALLLLSAGVQGAARAIAAQEGAGDDAGWTGLLSPFTLVDGVGRRLLGTDSTLLAPPGVAGAVVPALLVLALVAGCTGLLLLRYRRVL